MKSYKLSILAGCVSLIMSNVSWSDNSHSPANNVGVSQEESMSISNDNALNGLKALFNDSHADIHLRTVYFNPQSSKIQGKEQSWKSAALGSQFNFYSGYAFDHVGFDWSVFNTLGLERSGNKVNASGQFLTMKANGKYPTNLFVPAGVAALKFKAGNDKVYMDAKAGLISISDEILVDSSPRAIPSTYRGIHVNANIHDISLYTSFANAVRKRAEKGLQIFKSNTGKKISYISETGARYTFSNGLGLKVAYGRSNNYLNQYLGQLTYDVEGLGNGILSLKGKSYFARKGGKLWNGKDLSLGQLDGFEKNASVHSFTTNYAFDAWNFGLAYTKINAKGGAGMYKYKLAPNAYGMLNVNSSVNSDFNLDGENAYQTSVGYSFKKIPGLSAKFVYTKGTGINYKKNKNIIYKEENEFDYSLAYAFQQPALKGLQVRGTYYDVRQTGVRGLSDRADTKNNYTHELRVFADYKVIVF